MKKYIIAHDLGTSGNKATLFSSEGQLVDSASYQYPLFVAENNVAEQNAEDWWVAVRETTKKLLQKVSPSEIAAVSFSGQMMGCLCVAADGKPLHNSLIWADMRSTKQQQALENKISAKEFYQTTGHRLSASYTITKLMWVKENLPDVYEHTYKVLNAKDYIILKLTDKFVTEPSDASSTCLFDLNTMRWSQKLLDVAGLDMDKMPTILQSVDVAGGVTKWASEQTGLVEGTPVVCDGGDGCCAAVGSGVVKEGVANCCLGTSSWISLATKKPVYDESMSTFNFAHIVPGYCMPCGTMQTGGGALNWAVDNLFSGVDERNNLDKNAIYQCVRDEVEKSPLGAKNLLFLPYLMGERSPRWNDKAKGAFVGLTLNHNRGDMLRAVMEGVGYNLEIILQAFRRYESDINSLILIGGGARNEIWQQILCDILNLPIIVPNYINEATSMGAAITAGVGVGLFESFDVVEKFLKMEKENLPQSDNVKIYARFKALFEQTYQALINLTNQL